jgi:uncharacterized protein (DUF4415 family)
MAKRYGKPDAENPEWTREELARAKPAGEVFPAAVFADAPPKRGRGPQAAPTKQLVSLRLDRDTVETYRATGRGWQARINDDLAKAARRISVHPTRAEAVAAAKDAIRDTAARRRSTPRPAAKKRQHS